MRLGVVVIALVFASRSAHAGREVGIIATGDSARRGEVSERVAGWLRERGFMVVAAPLSTDAVETLTNCFTLEDLVCARGVFDARSKAESLVFVRIDPAGKNVTFNLYWFAKGKPPVGERRVCEKCTAPAWHELTATMLDRLAGDAVPGGDRGRGADGASEGRPSRLGPSILLGAGVAMLAVGGIFLYYGSLDDADQKYIYPESTPVAIALGTVGLGATIGGTIWLIQTGSSSGPVASATRGGAYVGWVGHF